MKILFGMPSKDSLGGPISSEPPFVKAIAQLGVETEVSDYVYGSKIGERTGVSTRISRVIKTALKFRRLLRSGEFDILHLNTAFDRRTVLRDSFTLWLLRGVSDTSIFLKFHGSELEEFKNKGFFWSFLLRLIDRYSDGIGVHTKKEIEVLRELGFETAKFYVVKNVIPEAEESSIGPTGNDGSVKRLVFAGRFVPEKCITETIGAVGILRERGYDVRLTALGDGPEMENSRALVALMDLEDAVDFPGYIPEKEVPEHLKRSDVFMFPTRNGEGFPNIFFKSMCFGLPIVTSSFRYADENCIDGEHCIYCETTPESVADATERLLKDPELCKRIAKNNLRDKQSLTGRSVAKEFLKIYEELA